MNHLIWAFVISSAMVIIRAIINWKLSIHLKLAIWILLVISLVGNVLAYSGFSLLIHTSQSIEADYATVLTVFSLLAAGVIAGYFTFSYKEAGKNEHILPNMISICYSGLFHFIFGAVCYYMALSPKIAIIKNITIITPLIMLTILVGNTIFDYWDYKKDR